MILTFSKSFAKGPYADLVTQTVAKVGRKLYKGNLVASITWATKRRVRFTIETKDAWAHGSRTSASGRHMRKASWEAHRDVMRAIFALDGAATIKATLATYCGFEDFEAKYLATGNKNVGSMMELRTMRECSI